ncbi:MAG TPA: thiamine pyrophosphate-binding protein [Burkholderiales bacterium]
MPGKTSNARSTAAIDWPAAIYRALKSQRVRQVSYVPDAGHKRLIDLCHADRDMAVVPLTTEEEGIGLAAGAWLGGERATLLMQSSGVGNCINTLTLASNCGFPLLIVVTMRGEWGEFNPWQIPMGQTTPDVLRLSGVRTLRLERAEDALATVTAAARLAFEGYAAAAVLIGQRMIGTKTFEDKP